MSLLGSSVTLPQPSPNPEYLVPSHTTQLIASASASMPILFDFGWWLGDPHLVSSLPPDRRPTGTFAASSLSPGLWWISPYETGADGSYRWSPVAVNTSFQVTTLAFDGSVSSPTGDLWLRSIEPTAELLPALAEPGQTITIPLTITPDGAPGTRVSGTVYVDDASLINPPYFPNCDYSCYYDLQDLRPEASDVTAFNYEYTIGAATKRAAGEVGPVVASKMGPRVRFLPRRAGDSSGVQPPPKETASPRSASSSPGDQATSSPVALRGRPRRSTTRPTRVS